MNISKQAAGAVLGVTLFIGTLMGGGSFIFAQGPDVTPPAAASENEVPHDDDDDVYENEVEDDDDDAAESAALQGLATISAADAEAAALADHPSATALEVELDRENGQVVYEVELDNGLEVIVDAADGTVLGTEIDD